MDIEQYNPKKNPKYSNFIYRFLKKNKKVIPHRGMPVIEKFDTLGIWRIGWHDSDGWFIGAPISFLPNGKVEIYAFKPGGQVVEKVEWCDYKRIGACAIDGYAHKWREVNKNSRCCEYCGQWIRRKVKTEKVIRRRDIWEIES